MAEFVSEALVLSREPFREFDARFSFFTKKSGKLIAKARSVRKVASKLSGHLQPGNFARLRVVEKNGPQIVDAIKYGTFSARPDDLFLLGRILSEGEADPGLWAELSSGKLRWRPILKILGWDPDLTTCVICGSRDSFVFRTKEQDFLCKECVLKFRGDELLYILM